MADNEQPKKQPREQTPEERAKRFAMQSAGEMSVWDEQEKRWVKLSEMARLKEERQAQATENSNDKSKQQSLLAQIDQATQELQALRDKFPQ